MSRAPSPTAFAVLLIVFAGCSNERLSDGRGPATGRDTPSATTGTPLASADAPSPATDTSRLRAGPGDSVEDAPYWPRFHGPKGDNISTDRGLLKEWPEGGPELAWSTKGIGEGFSSVAIAGGLIYTGGNVGENTVVTSLDMEGNIQWQTENGKAWTNSPAGTRGTPTVDGNRLFDQSPLGDVVCLDAKSGERIWGLNVLEQFGANNITWALAESLLVDGNHLISCPGGEKASVVALDKATGQTVWASPSTGEQTSYATPTLAECQGMRMILAMNAKALIGISADSGDLLFRHEHLTEYDVNALKPIYHDGHVFISSGYGSGSELLKISADGGHQRAPCEAWSVGRAGVQRVWESKELDNHHGGVILLDGYLYGSGFRGDWICLEWESGKLMYAEPGVDKGSLTYADGMLYTLSENRKVGLVEAVPTGHAVKSQFELPSGGQGKSWAHPVVCGGRLYLRHSDQLSAYNVRAEP